MWPRLWASLLLAILATWTGACAKHEGKSEEPPRTLSSWGLFLGDGSTQEPAASVIPYDLNTPLFSDYALKYRFVRLPEGRAAQYREGPAFEFPVGTVIAKTFAYPVDERDLSRGRRLLETRLLVHEEEGWVGLPYVWNEEQSEAYLEIAGERLEVSWIHRDGTPRDIRYMVPNANQCKGCHEESKGTMSPIGPRARHLNRDFPYPGGVENQLVHWSRVGALEGAPLPEEAPRLPVWDDPGSGTLDERARAWLEVNCAHCHNPDGPADTSGLDLRYEQRRPSKWGVFKSPVAAGRGSGDRRFGIVPGKPEESILLFRIRSTDPGVMMPELGRRLVHEESVALIEEWILNMEDPREEPESRVSLRGGEALARPAIAWLEPAASPH